MANQEQEQEQEQEDGKTHTHPSSRVTAPAALDARSECQTTAHSSPTSVRVLSERFDGLDWAATANHGPAKAWNGTAVQRTQVVLRGRSHRTLKAS